MGGALTRRDDRAGDEREHDGRGREGCGDDAGS